MFDKEAWSHVLPEAVGVVASIGPPHPFGKDDFMERISGDANVAAIEAASAAGVPNLAFISAAPADEAAQVPSFILKVHFTLLSSCCVLSKCMSGLS